MKPTFVFNASRALLALPILLLCALLALAGCGQQSAGKPAATATPTPPPTASEILAKARSASLKDATFDEQITTMSGSTNAQITANGQFTANPPRLELKETVLGKQSDEIIDGSTFYLNSGSGWKKYAAGKLAQTSSYASSLTQLQNPQLVGEETVNGQKAYHLRGDLPQDAAAAAAAQVTIKTATEDLWVLETTYYPAKALQHLVGSLNSQDVTVDTQITFTAWNTGVTITPPQDATAG